MARVIDMAGKAALVTGAASGLGRASALRLAEAGADLCIVDINAAGLAETASLLGAHGRAVLVHAADLRGRAACQAAVAQYGRLDTLCNIAGIVKFVHAGDMTEAEWDRVLAVNLSAPFFLSQAAIPHLLAAGGAIVNCASTAAFVGQAYLGAYCASKAGLVQLTKAMAMEYIHAPIRINAVAPGGMMTNIFAGAAFPEGIDRTLIDRYAGIRGMVEVADVAEMVAMLASDAGRAYHGACVSIDAGITAG